jgi:hypothetical protein
VKKRRLKDGKSESPEEILAMKLLTKKSSTTNEELQIERSEIPLNSGTINYKL